MSNLKRYDWDYDQLDHEYSCVECSEGEWVKFADIKEFLPTSAQQSKAGSEDCAQISARMLELAADPCRDGYVPMSPETLREWAQKLLPC